MRTMTSRMTSDLFLDGLVPAPFVSLPLFLDGLVPARGEKRGPVDFRRSQNSNLGGGEEPDRVFSLGHTVGRYFTRQQLTHGVDHGGKLEAINIPANRKRHVEVMARMKMCHDVEVNPGPAKSKLRCTICNEGFKKKEWSVKCNGCKKWTHWNCTLLGEDGRCSTSFRAQCCTPRSRMPMTVKRKRWINQPWNHEPKVTNTWISPRETPRSGPRSVHKNNEEDRRDRRGETKSGRKTPNAWARRNERAYGLGTSRERE